MGCHHPRDRGEGGLNVSAPDDDDVYPPVRTARSEHERLLDVAGARRSGTEVERPCMRPHYPINGKYRIMIRLFPLDKTIREL